MKTGRELTLEWFNRVWNNLEESAIDELMCKDCEIQGLNLAEKGPEGFKQFYRSYCAAFENIVMEVFELVEEEGLVLGHVRFTGTHLGSGKNVDIVVSLSVRWVNGKASFGRNVADFVTLLAQIGSLNPEILSEAIQGPTQG